MSDEPKSLANLPLGSVRPESVDLILAMLRKHFPDRKPAPPKPTPAPSDPQVFREPTPDEGMYQIWTLDEHGNRQHKIEGHCCQTEQDFQDYLAMISNVSGGKARAELVPSPGFEEVHKPSPSFKPKR